ncbi:MULTISPECIES: hypothetical protein [Mucilaginibacter]|uniref:hypothetical protein n=1 Tax=Mucilaginibacter TaxID=423349 RepID=UPI002092CAB2|nr:MULTISPECIES: hypothetical protein [Mucilaginibacter]
MQTPNEEYTNQQPSPENKEPIFLPRTNGWGWSLNFNRRESYFVLAIILGVPFAVVLCVILFVK